MSDPVYDALLQRGKELLHWASANNYEATSVDSNEDSAALAASIVQMTDVYVGPIPEEHVEPYINYIKVCLGVAYMLGLRDGREEKDLSIREEQL